MTAANHFLDANGRIGSADRTPREISVKGVVQLFTRLIAVVLLLVAPGIWIAPHMSSLPELFLMKLCGSFIFALLGIHLLFMARHL